MANSTITCMCDDNNDTEYYTAVSDFEPSTPSDWRTSTRYYDVDGDVPEYVPVTPPRAPRRNRTSSILQTTSPGTPRRGYHVGDITAGVAIVPRRIDFDATSNIEDLDEQEDLGASTWDTLQQSRVGTRPRSNISASEGYRRRARATQYPQVSRQYLPRMTKATPCGKCLRI